MTHSLAEPWTHPLAFLRLPAVGLTPQWIPGTGALLSYVAARQRANIVVHLGEKKLIER